MPNDPLYDREWCDLVFEHRNRDYGAYELRRLAGRRYRYVMAIFGSIFLALLIAAGVMAYHIYTLAKEAASEIDKIAKMEPLKSKEEYEIKKISAGRKVTPHMAKNASEAMPVITEESSNTLPIGEATPDEIDIDEKTFVAVDMDKQHNAEQKDLPVEGAQLTATEVVEEMPQFPGGLKALMQYLDEHVTYPEVCQKGKVTGTVEVTFIVDVDGSILDARVTQKAHPRLDKAALTAIEGMAKWKPGKYHGFSTPVQVTIPVQFSL
ncbi:MAG: energy transducer TonB [Bacteroidales bacterium]|nr:energy transducer TonB [Candidatus Equimonas enterica]